MNKFLSLAAISALTAGVSLNATTTDMEKVVVTASKTEQQLANVTANVTVITAEELEQAHFSDVASALEHLAGLSLTRNGGLGKSTSLFLRGFDSKRVLVLIDGIRYNDPTGLSGAPFEHLMIGDIERIEVLKGAQSGVWGADASAGVINIITKAAAQGTHATASAEYGSYNTKNFGAGLSHKAEAYDLKVSIQKIESDGFSAQVPRGKDADDYEADGYTNTTAKAVLGVNLTASDRIEARYTGITAENEADPYANADGKDNSLTDDRFASVHFNHVDSFNTFTLYAQQSDFSREYPQGWTKKFDGGVKEQGASSMIPYQNGSFVLIGADKKEFSHQNYLEKSYANSGLFLTNSNRFGATVVTESVRSDSYDAFDDKVTGKIGLKQEMGGELSLCANYGTANNVPTPFNLFDPTYGNPDLTPESTTGYDISLSAGWAKVTYFANEVEEMIDFDMTTWTYDNVKGSSTFKGAELELNGAVDALNTAVSFNYTRLEAKNSDGEMLKRRPKDQADLNIDWYANEALMIGLNARYVGERYEQDGEQGTQTGNYSLFNAVGNYAFDESLSCYVKLDNLGDKRYQVVDGYGTAERSIYAGVTARF